jgi:hypothetical protein
MLKRPYYKSRMGTPETNTSAKGLHFIEQDLSDVAYADPRQLTTEQDSNASEVVTRMMDDISSFLIRAANKQVMEAKFNRLFPETESTAD